ncbi:DNA polymerase III subunit delta [Limosilactobacillus pulli]|uniref:DNA polymerase III subunit delta n=1 Tax=Limosilactobacillus pulli TaxID=2991833 RepID=UPI0024BA115A|nr:DNA polymerase III subunit delta [Limosilactobacillus pulli]
MDVATLRQQLNGQAPAMVYVVLGTQGILQQQARDAFMGLIPEAERVMNVGSYDMETTPLATAIDDAMSAPFFGERRLVLINKPYFLTGSPAKVKVNHDLDALKSYLEHPEPSTVLVLMAPYEKLDNRKGLVKELKKVAIEVSAAPLSEQDARHQVEQQLLSDGYRLANGTMDELVRRTNADYGLMVANLKKLELLAYQTKQISQGDVIGLVPQSLDENVFDLITAVLKRDQAQALDIYQQLLETNHEPLQLNALLVGQFRLLIQIKVLSSRGLSQGTLASRLKVHPYRVKIGMQTARRFQMNDLVRAYLGLIRCEKALKTTARDPELLFQLFMLQFAKKAG